MSSQIKQQLDGTAFAYGVELHYAPEDVALRYIMHVAYIRPINNDYHCKVERAQVFINGIQPQRLVDVLAERCMQHIYPVDLLVSSFSGIKAVLNFDTLKQRWHKALETLKEEFTGTYASQYFKQIDHSLANADDFLDTLKNELFYTLFFFKKEGLYSKGATKKEVINSLPVLPYKGMQRFKGTVEIENKDDFIVFNYNGYNTTKDHVKLCHSIYKDNLAVRRISGTYESTVQNKTVQFKITELKERETQYVAPKEAPEAIPKHMIKKKKINLAHLFGLKKQ